MVAIFKNYLFSGAKHVRINEEVIFLRSRLLANRAEENNVNRPNMENNLSFLNGSKEEQKGSSFSFH